MTEPTDGADCWLVVAGFSFEGLYLPWALIAFTVLIGGSPMMDIFGVIAGHLYYFLLEVLPTTKGWNLIQTPAILYAAQMHVEWISQWTNCVMAMNSVRLFPSPQAFGATPIIGARGAGAAPAAPGQQGGGYAWGTGRALGSM